MKTCLLSLSLALITGLAVRAQHYPAPPPIQPSQGQRTDSSVNVEDGDGPAQKEADEFVTKLNFNGKSSFFKLWTAPSIKLLSQGGLAALQRDVEAAYGLKPNVSGTYSSDVSIRLLVLKLRHNLSEQRIEIARKKLTKVVLTGDPANIQLLFGDLILGVLSQAEERDYCNVQEMTLLPAFQKIKQSDREKAKGLLLAAMPARQLTSCLP